MSLTKFEEQDFKKPIPEEILDRVKENMETYNLDLSDALEEAARELAAKDSLLWRAWYYNDYREFIPCAYIKKFLNFEKYPLAYAMDKFELFMCCRGNGTTISNKAVLEYGDYKNIAHIEDCGRLTWYSNPENLPKEICERIMQYATSRHAEWEKWLEKKSEFKQYCILFEELTIKQQNAIVLDHSKESVLQKIDRMKTIIGNDLERNMFATTATPGQKERR